MRFGKARVPTNDELRRLHSVTKNSAHGLRNTALVTMLYRLRFRAKELASLSIFDLFDSAGSLGYKCALTGHK